MHWKGVSETQECLLRGFDEIRTEIEIRGDLSMPQCLFILDARSNHPQVVDHNQPVATQCQNYYA